MRFYKTETMCNYFVTILVLLVGLEFGDCVVRSYTFRQMCGEGAYYNAPVLQQEFIHESQTQTCTQCASHCGIRTDCTGFNFCRASSSEFDCQLVANITSGDIDCSILSGRDNCTLSFKYEEAEMTTTTETPPTEGCSPTNALFLPEYSVCYWALDGGVSNQNLTVCEDTGGYLAVIPSQKVMMKLQIEMNAQSYFNKTKRYWIDANDRDTEGVFLDRYGPVEYSAIINVMATPGNLNDCVTVSPPDNYQWFDEVCSLTYPPLCYQYSRDDGYRRILTVEAGTGKFYGRKSELIMHAYLGERMKILLYNYAANIDFLINVDVIKLQGKDMCVESLNNMQTDYDMVKRVAISVCISSSLVRVLKSYNGYPSHFNETKHYRMTWFTTDAMPQQNNTSENLTSAISTGSDIILKSQTTILKLRDLYYGAHVFGKYAYCETKSKIWSDWNYVTAAEASTLREVHWEYETNATTLTKQNAANFDLLTGSSWDVVYSHDSTGTALFGSITELKTAIGSGRRVKVDVGGWVWEPDTIHSCIFSDQIYAITSSVRVPLRNNVEPLSDLERTVTIVSVDGDIMTYTVSERGPTILNSSSARTSVRWFVDTGRWVVVYYTTAPGNGADGLITLNEVFSAGQPIRIMILPSYYRVFFTVDNVRRDKSTGLFTASMTRSWMIIERLQNGKLLLDIDPPLLYVNIEVCTDGYTRGTFVANGDYKRQMYVQSGNGTLWYSKPYIF